MPSLSSTRGFTLLELLLVVGIAAILIVAGVVTYTLVSKGYKINETVRLIHQIRDSMHRLYGYTNTYGTTVQSSEALVVNSANIPDKYRSQTPGEIATPFSQDAGALTITGSATPGVMTLSIAVPPSFAPEIGASLIPQNSGEITSLTVCGGTPVTDAAGSTYSPATTADDCGDSDDVPATPNIVILSR